MQISEVTYSRSVRVNLGDFQGTEFFISMKAQLEDGEGEREAASKLRNVIERALAQDILRHFKARGKTTLSLAEVSKRYGLETSK